MPVCTIWLCLKPAYAFQRDDTVNCTINSSLTVFPERICWIWTTTRDSILRKFNYTQNYRYGIHLQITRKTPHIVFCILLAGDVATNPGPDPASNAEFSNRRHMNDEWIECIIPQRTKFKSVCHGY